MKITTSIANNYASQILRLHLENKSYDHVIVDFLSKYKNNKLLEASGGFTKPTSKLDVEILKKRNQEFISAIQQTVRDLKLSLDRKSQKIPQATNFQRFVGAIGKMILKYANKNLTLDPTGYKISSNLDDFDFDDSDAKEPAVMNPPAEFTPRPVMSHYNPQLTFKNYFAEQEILHKFEHVVYKQVANDEKLDEIFGLFGKKTLPSRTSHESSLEDALGGKEYMTRELENIMDQFIKALKSHEGNATPEMKQLLNNPKGLLNSLEKKKSEILANPLAWVQKYIKEKDLVHRDEEEQRGKGLVGGTLSKLGLRKNRFEVAERADMDDMFDEYLRLMGIDLDSFVGKSSTELQAKIENALNSLDEENKNAFSNFMQRYEKYYKQRFKEMLKKAARELKQVAKTQPKLARSSMFSRTMVRLGGAAVLFAMIFGSTLNQKELSDNLDQVKAKVVQVAQAEPDTSGPPYEPDMGPDDGSGPYPDSPSSEGPEASGVLPKTINVKPGNVGRSSGEILAGKGPLGRLGAKILPGSDFNKVQGAERSGRPFETTPRPGIFRGIFGGKPR
jgi:hypothetical protein